MANPVLTNNEIARRLFKPRWADTREYAEALDAFFALDEKNMEDVAHYAVLSRYVTGAELLDWYAKNS